MYPGNGLILPKEEEEEEEKEEEEEDEEEEEEVEVLEGENPEERAGR